MTDMFSEKETITPIIAKYMLGMSAGNRSIKRAKVEAYTRDILAEKWVLNGEAIIFDGTGALIDGHHRLAAVMRAQKSIETLVVRGVTKDARKTIDMGASRTAGDALGFYGFHNGNHLNAIIRILMSAQNGRARSANPSTQEVFSFVDEHPGVIASASFASGIKGVPKLASFLGALHFVSADDAERFAHVMVSGVPHYQGCAAHALRERIIKSRISGPKILPAEMHLLAASAWEKFLKRTPVKTLKPRGSFAIAGWE